MVIMVVGKTLAEMAAPHELVLKLAGVGDAGEPK